VILNFGSIDLLYPACGSRLSSGAKNVPGVLMSEKLRKATLTGSGTWGELLLDARRPIIQAAASYAESVIDLVSYALYH
jgi:hypothetical protein